ncbi:MAG: threonine--tRNA ligase [Candidatus Micrarchaeaceae archaeon]
MRVLQFDVANIEYALIKPESSVYEESSKKRERVENAIALFVCVEKGDTEDEASAAVNDAIKFAEKQKVPKLILYPFAHLSSNLAAPSEAMKLFKYMADLAGKSKIEVHAAPFGWNKQLSINVKGYPFAEQSKAYGKHVAKVEKVSERIDTSIVKKSDWSGLPENDHRTIGEKLDLYSFQEVSPGMVYWHPNGLVIYNELVKFMREKEAEYDYQEISTPEIANVALWKVSGHLEHYNKDMFIFDSSLGRVGLKPMNCPSTMLIYKSRKWSYRELPFRTAIFDKLHRSELSGVATGLLRVKEMTQDDGHVFIREDQIESEITSLLKMVGEVYGAFGMKYAAKLSTMPDDHMGDEKQWEKATEALKAALDANGIKYVIKEKEGAFYGPKIDFDVFDSQGRAWQCATIQLDYQLPQRFKLSYNDKDGRQRMPVVVHRAILGTLERFIGILVEHYQGKFPTWLAPEQAKVIAISEKTNDYAEQVNAELKKAKVRAKCDTSDRTIEYKIREALNEKPPYIVVLGEKERKNGNITVRSRSGAQKQMSIKEFESMLKAEVESRSNVLSF